MSKQDYESKLAQFEAMNQNQVKEPNMPVDAGIQEAEDLYAWCQPDKVKLEKAGLDWNYVVDLPARIGACREAESIWNKERKQQTEAIKQWKEKSPAAFELRNELVHHFKHAFRHEADLRARVAAIEEGHSNADMIQDLSDLAVLGNEHKDKLEKSHLELSLLDTAYQWSDELGTILGIANGQRYESSPAKVIRDKAFSHMKEAVDEIRYHGQYVFWRDPNRKKGYISKYFKNRGKNGNDEKPSDDNDNKS